MSLLTKYRLVLGLFTAGLVLSGVTAFPLAWETELLTRWLGISATLPPESYSGVAFWLSKVHRGLHETYAVHPWIAYGTDWLAFAHVAIAVYFIGPLNLPRRFILIAYSW